MELLHRQTIVHLVAFMVGRSGHNVTISTRRGAPRRVVGAANQIAVPTTRRWESNLVGFPTTRRGGSTTHHGDRVVTRSTNSDHHEHVVHERRVGYTTRPREKDAIGRLHDASWRRRFDCLPHDASWGSTTRRDRHVMSRKVNHSSDR